MQSLLQIFCALLIVWFLNREDTIQNSLNILNSVPKQVEKKKMLFAFSSDEDIQVQATQLLKELKCTKNHLNTQTICGDILYHFQNGLGSELHITQGFDWIVEISKRISTSKDLGGNAAQMALRAFKEGGDVYLSAIMSTHYYQQLFNGSISIIPKSFLREQIDDVHIVINFDEGDEYDTIICKQTNRLYLQNDQDNIRFPGLDMLQQEIFTIQPHALIIGGFQLMNQKSRIEYEEIILKLEKILINNKNNLKIHFEMGAFNDEKLLLYLIEHIFPHIHSTGMNEQELQILYNYVKSGQLQKEQYLDTNQQIEMVIKIIQLLKIDRIHFHSQTIQMICSTSDWNDITYALHRSILVGLIQAMKTQNDNSIDDKYTDNSNLLIQLEDDNIKFYPNNTTITANQLKQNMLHCWDIDQHKCCVAPVLINPHPMRTCGLGDNIGSTSILYQL